MRQPCLEPCCTPRRMRVALIVLTLAMAPAARGAGMDGVWQRQGPPSGRYGHQAFYDPVDDRALLLERRSSGEAPLLWAHDLAAPADWSHIPSTGHGPSHELTGGAIYDPVRRRIVTFGGSVSTPSWTNETWSLDLETDPPSWSQLSPTGTPPPARAACSAIYDPLRDRMIVFGGRAAGWNYHDVWELRFAPTLEWVEIVASNPPVGRAFHAAVYDSQRDRMLMCGGDSALTAFDDLWSLPLSGQPDWIQLTPSGTGPGPILGHALIYDSTADALVVYGGSDAFYGGACSSDVHVLDLGTEVWSVLSPTGNIPSPRFFHSALYDPVRSQLIAFGGFTAGQVAHFNDTWALALEGSPAWTLLHQPSGLGPASTEMLYEPVGDRLLTYGADGVAAGALRQMLLTGSEWTDVPTTGVPPSPRSDASMTYDPVRGRYLLFGGLISGPVMVNEVWALDLSSTPPTWAQLAPSGPIPPARAGHFAAYDSERDRLVVYGGQAIYGLPIPENFLEDVWALSLSDLQWTQLFPTGSPGRRTGKVAVYDLQRDRMVIYGGTEYTGGATYGRADVWALSLETPAWTELSPTGSPPLGSPRAAYDPLRDRLVMWPTAFSGLPVLLLEGPAWTHLPIAEPEPSGGSYSSVVYDPLRDQVLVFSNLELWKLAGAAAPVSTPLPWVDTGPDLALSGFSPNPSRGTPQIRFTLASSKPVKLKLLDVAGRLVLAREIQAPAPGTHVLTLATPHGLEPGIYFISIQQDGKAVTRRGVVVR